MTEKSGLDSLLPEASDQDEKKEPGSALQQSRRIVRVMEELLAGGQEITPKAKMDYALAKAMVEKDEQKMTAESARMFNERPLEFRQALDRCLVIVKVVERMKKEGRPLPEEAQQDYDLACRFLTLHATVIKRLLDGR